MKIIRRIIEKCNVYIISFIGIILYCLFVIVGYVNNGYKSIPAYQQIDIQYESGLYEKRGKTCIFVTDQRNNIDVGHFDYETTNYRYKSQLMSEYEREVVVDNLPFYRVYVLRLKVNNHDFIVDVSDRSMDIVSYDVKNISKQEADVMSRDNNILVITNPYDSLMTNYPFFWIWLFSHIFILVITIIILYTTVIKPMMEEYKEQNKNKYKDKI